MMFPISELLDHWFSYYMPCKPTRADAKRLHYNDNNIISLDIETTSIERNGKKTAFPYIWMIGFKQDIFYSRDFTEIETILEKLSEYRCINVIYCHNLGYEFQFLRNILNFDYVFARKTRKPIFARWKNIEFRCSYFLSNMSLAQVGENYCVRFQKLAGELDYTKTRLPCTKLTETEMHYCENDIRVLNEYLESVLQKADGKWKNVPYTSTGYVRKELQSFIKEKGWYNSQRRLVQKIAPNLELYKMLREAYCGGITHANYLAVLHGTYTNVPSYDKASSYPWGIVSQKYPMERFKQVRGNYLFFTKNKDYAWVARVKISRIIAKNANCVISRHKCISAHKDTVSSNGRIFSSSEIVITITDVDKQSIDLLYDYEKIEYEEMYISRYSYLPKSIVLFVLELYQRKTELKGIKGQEDLYMYTKQLINSVYGMMVLDPYTDPVYFSENEWGVNDASPEMLTDYYSKYNTVLVYQWGVWVTAHSRLSLVKSMEKAGDDCLYVDTDSIKTNGTTNFIEEINNQIHADNQAACAFFGVPWDKYAPLDKHGTRHEIGLFEYEYTADFFKTLGSKRYLVYKNGELHATVAGVPKSNIESYLAKQGTIKKSFDAFDFDLTLSGEYNSKGINESGKTTMLYIDTDEPELITVTDYQGNPETVSVGYCVHASGASFKMSVSPTYKLFLAHRTITEKVITRTCNGKTVR